MHHVTLKTGVMATERLALHHRNTFHLNKYLHRKQLFKIVMIFYNITVLLYFCSNKCRLEKSDSDFFQNIKKFLQPKIFK